MKTRRHIYDSGICPLCIFVLWVSVGCPIRRVRTCDDCIGVYRNDFAIFGSCLQK